MENEEDKQAQYKWALNGLAAAADAIKGSGADAAVTIMLYEGKLLWQFRAKTELVAAALCVEAGRTAAFKIKHPLPPGTDMIQVEEALEEMPEAERETYRAAVRSMLDNNMQGARRVFVVDAGTSECPGCEEPLRLESMATLLGHDGEATEHMVCTGCKAAFTRPRKGLDA